jgi:predicted metal-dependent HD superfamily phosphohydrolase
MMYLYYLSKELSDMTSRSQESQSSGERDYQNESANRLANRFGLDLALPPELGGSKEIVRAILLAGEILQGVDRIHGTGDGVTQVSMETGKHAPYHHGQHTREVIEGAVEHLLMSGDIDPMNYALAIIAGAFHDVVQVEGRGQNEIVSAQLAIGTMTERGYESSQIYRVSQAVLGTTLRFDADSNSCDQEAYESKDPVVVAVAVGDLGKLAQYDAAEASFRWFMEINGDMLAGLDELTFLDAARFFDNHEGARRLVAYLKDQETFYTNFRYPKLVGSDVDSYDGHRLQNGKLLTRLGKKVKSGEMSVSDVYEFVSDLKQVG